MFIPYALSVLPYLKKAQQLLNWAWLLGGIKTAVVLAYWFARGIMAKFAFAKPFANLTYRNKEYKPMKNIKFHFELENYSKHYGGAVN